jgi:hypothetical protein
VDVDKWWPRVLRLVVLVVLGVMSGLVFAGGAQASPPDGGMVIVFDRTSSVGGLGHVGWGFYDPSTNAWTYGAVEGGGSGYIPAGEDNGAWSEIGTFDQMFQAMSEMGYDEAVELPTSAADITAAQEVVAAQADNGYVVVLNDCLTNTEHVLAAYGADLPTTNEEDILGNTVPNVFATEVAAEPGAVVATVPQVLNSPQQYDPAANDPNTDNPYGFNPAQPADPPDTTPPADSAPPDASSPGDPGPPEDTSPGLCDIPTTCQDTGVGSDGP